MEGNNGGGAIIATHGTLMSHERVTQIVDRSELDLIEAPEATDTFQPIKHGQLISSVEESLARRGLNVERSEFAVSLDGMKLFGLLEIDAVHSGIRFAIGLRNSNDKSMRLGMVAGYRVVVCDNMMLAGDFKSLLAKHTKGFDLIETVALGVDRIHRNFEPMLASVEAKRQRNLDDDHAKGLIYDAFINKGFPIGLMKKVDRNYFSPPHEDFSGKTVWSLENAFTESFKELKPLARFQSTVKLTRFLEPNLALPA